MAFNLSRRRFIGTGLGVGAGLAVGASASASTSTSAGAVALVGVAVIDATGAPPTPGMTLLARGDRIVAVGASRTVRVPDDAAVIDGRGKFVIPGLVDMHVHSSGVEAIDPP